MPKMSDDMLSTDKSVAEARAHELRLQAGRGDPLRHHSPYCGTCLGVGIDPKTEAYCKCRYDQYRYGLRPG